MISYEAPKIAKFYSQQALTILANQTHGSISSIPLTDFEQSLVNSAIILAALGH